MKSYASFILKNLPEVPNEDFEVKLHAATIDIDNLPATSEKKWSSIIGTVTQVYMKYNIEISNT